MNSKGFKEHPWCVPPERVIIVYWLLLPLLLLFLAKQGPNPQCDKAEKTKPHSTLSQAFSGSREMAAIGTYTDWVSEANTLVNILQSTLGRLIGLKLDRSARSLTFFGIRDIKASSNAGGMWPFSKGLLIHLQQYWGQNVYVFFIILSKKSIITWLFPSIHQWYSFAYFPFSNRWLYLPCFRHIDIREKQFLLPFGNHHGRH